MIKTKLFIIAILFIQKLFFSHNHKTTTFNVHIYYILYTHKYLLLLFLTFKIQFDQCYIEMMVILLLK